VKLALPAGAMAPLRVARKVAGVKAMAGPAFTLMVPALKSMSTRRCTTLALSSMAMVVLPVKPVTALGRSRPVLRPVSWAGAGTAE